MVPPSWKEGILINKHFLTEQLAFSLLLILKLQGGTRLCHPFWSLLYCSVSFQTNECEARNSNSGFTGNSHKGEPGAKNKQTVKGTFSHVRSTSIHSADSKATKQINGEIQGLSLNHIKPFSGGSQDRGLANINCCPHLKLYIQNKVCIFGKYKTNLDFLNFDSSSLLDKNYCGCLKLSSHQTM